MVGGRTVYVWMADILRTVAVQNDECQLRVQILLELLELIPQASEELQRVCEQRDRHWQGDVRRPITRSPPS